MAPACRDDGSTTTYSAPGNGSASATTTTSYDGTFHVFPEAVAQPNGLVEGASYDYRMGTLTGVNNPNGNVTTAT